MNNNFLIRKEEYRTAADALATAEADLTTLTARAAALAGDLANARAAVAEGEADLAAVRKKYLSGTADAEAVHAAEAQLEKLQGRYRHLADLANALNGETTAARNRADRARREADRTRQQAFRALRSDLIAGLPVEVVEALLDIAAADEFPPMPGHEFACAVEFLTDRPDFRDIRHAAARRSDLGRRHGLD